MDPLSSVGWMDALSRLVGWMHYVGVFDWMR